MSHYSLLGVGPDASRRDIERAFRRLARRFHPDLNRGDVRADEHMKVLNEARDTLTDPARRAAYDAQLGGAPDARATWTPTAPAARAQAWRPAAVPRRARVSILRRGVRLVPTWEPTLRRMFLGLLFGISLVLVYRVSLPRSASEAETAFGALTAALTGLLPALVRWPVSPGFGGFITGFAVNLLYALTVGTSLPIVEGAVFGALIAWVIDEREPRNRD